MIYEGVEFKIATCEEEYAKKPELNKEDIKQLLEWSKKQSHLPNITELQCIRYYNCNDLSLQKTKQFIEMHFTFKHEFPEMFDFHDFEPPKYNHSVWDILYIHKVDKLSHVGHTIIYGGFKDTDPKKFDWDIAVSAFHKVILASALEGISDGYDFILDMEGLKFEHIRMLTIPFIRKFFTYIQDTLEVKMKGVHIIRINSLLDKLLMLIKPFMRKELLDMLFFYAEMDKFFSVIPKEFITTDLNGTMPYTRKELNEATQIRLKDLKVHLIADIIMKTDESKRPYGVGTAPSLTASFKKLEVD